MLTTPASPTDPLASADLRHFVTLARRGQHGGCSGGERRAHEIAKSLIEHAVGLDPSATNGLIELVRLIERSPSAARDLIED